MAIDIRQESARWCRSTKSDAGSAKVLGCALMLGPQPTLDPRLPPERYGSSQAPERGGGAQFDQGVQCPVLEPATLSLNALSAARSNCSQELGVQRKGRGRRHYLEQVVRVVGPGSDAGIDGVFGNFAGWHWRLPRRKVCLTQPGKEGQPARGT